MSRYQTEEYLQLQNARVDLYTWNNPTFTSRIIGGNAITALLNIMIMIDNVDDDVRFRAKDIFEVLYRNMR